MRQMLYPEHNLLLQNKWMFKRQSVNWKQQQQHIKIAGFQDKLNKIFSPWQAAYI